MAEKSDEAKTITLKVMVNSTRNLSNAFRQIQITKELKCPTLFVISVANCHGFNGFRLN